MGVLDYGGLLAVSPVNLISDSLAIYNFPTRGHSLLRDMRRSSSPINYVSGVLTTRAWLAFSTSPSRGGRRTNRNLAQVRRRPKYLWFLGVVLLVGDPVPAGLAVVVGVVVAGAEAGGDGAEEGCEEEDGTDDANYIP